jgi:hypothetical protein
MEQVAAVGIGEVTVLSFFAYFLTIVVALLSAVLIQGIVMILAGAKKSKTKAVAAATPVQVSVAPEKTLEDPTAHVAAITAAIYAVVGAHRLVYIGEARPAYGWTTTGRTLHQLSHAPKRAPQR